MALRTAKSVRLWRLRNDSHRSTVRRPCRMVSSCAYCVRRAASGSSRSRIPALIPSRTRARNACAQLSQRSKPTWYARRVWSSDASSSWQSRSAMARASSSRIRIWHTWKWSGASCARCSSTSSRSTWVRKSRFFTTPRHSVKQYCSISATSPLRSIAARTMSIRRASSATPSAWRYLPSRKQRSNIAATIASSRPSISAAAAPAASASCCSRRCLTYMSMHCLIRVFTYSLSSATSNSGPAPRAHSTAWSRSPRW
mmetsp:Transcript_113/g.304  ORF Transcript_113/g.304 Transcript_113/m.304 type:complete len:256 (-) Transcript_113:301-1068(-)